MNLADSPVCWLQPQIRLSLCSSSTCFCHGCQMLSFVVLTTLFATANFGYNWPALFLYKLNFAFSGVSVFDIRHTLPMYCSFLVVIISSMFLAFYLFLLVLFSIHFTRTTYLWNHISSASVSFSSVVLVVQDVHPQFVTGQTKHLPVFV